MSYEDAKEMYGCISIPVFGGQGMVDVVVVRSVEHGVVCGKHRGFVPPVQVHPIPVEEHGEHSEHEVHVDGHDEGEDHHGQRAHELVQIFVRDDRERRRVVEHVVVAVDAPENVVLVAKQVIEIFGEVGEDEDDHELHKERQLGPVAATAISLRVSPLGSHQRKSRT